MQSLVVINFKLSVLVTLIGCVVMILGTSQELHDSVAYFGGKADYTLIAPAIIGSLTVFLWFAFYQHGEGHIPAFLIASGLLVPVLGFRISDSLFGSYYSDREQLFLVYASISHIAYALLNWQEIIKALESDAD